MPNFHATAAGPVQFTEQEEIEWAADVAARAIAKGAADKALANAAIQAEMDTADLKIVRALTEGDAARVSAHLSAQQARRAKLK